MHTTVVGVLRGGPSREHEVSLKSGATILKNLPDDRFHIRDVYIDKAGVWYERGLPTDPSKVLPFLDVAIVVIHGAFGQDGEVQKILESYNVPYTGPDPFSTFHASHKVMAKEKAIEAGVKVPRYLFAQSEDEIDTIAREAVRLFNQPVVVKPVDSGSSVGVSLVGGFLDIQKAMRDLFEDGARGVMVEERIKGKEATVGIVEGLRGEDLYALPPVEIVHHGHDFFSFDAKYAGTSDEIVPGRFSRDESDELRRLARVMHDALGQRHYSRSDFIISNRGIYFLELNTAAAVGMTGESLMPKSLAAIGVKLSDFATHLVELALKK